MTKLTLTLVFLGIHAGAALGARWADASTGLTGSVPLVANLVIDRSTGSTLYAQAAGSIFKSTDGGASWNALGNITGVLVLALDSTSASMIYAGTSHGVVKSTDGGASWSSAGLSDISVPVLAVDPITPSTLYAAGAGDQIYKSTDAGGTWTAFPVGLAPAFNIGVASLTLDSLTPSTLYVLARSLGSAIYKSTDGGQSWNVMGSDFFRFLAIAPTTPSTLYAIRGGSGFSTSTDGGATWTATGFREDVVALAIDPSNPDISYAATSAPVGSTPAIYKTLDGWTSWTKVNATVPTAGSLVLNPADSSTIYAATAGGVFESTNAGTQWSGTNIGLRVLGIQVLVGDPVDPVTIYAGGDDGLFKTVDGAGNWNKQADFQVTCCDTPPGLPPLPNVFPPIAPASVRSLFIDFTNPKILYLSTVRINGCLYTDVLLYKSTDGGSIWSDSTPKDFPTGCTAAGLMAMDPTDPNTLYLRYGNFDDGYSIRKSTDGGVTWTPLALSGYALNVLAIDPTTPATLYVGTDTGVSQSTDGGATWNVVGLANASVNLLAINPLQPNVLYAGTVGGLFKSTDHGVNWAPINTGLGDVLDARAPINALILDPNHPDVLYLGTSGLGVFRSSDGGATWKPLNDGLTNLDARVLAIARGDSPTLYAGTPTGVFKIVPDGN
jgi:photosystem II stability/assembly factor-like uncharacterized protein